MLLYPPNPSRKIAIDALFDLLLGCLHFVLIEVKVTVVDSV